MKTQFENIRYRYGSTCTNNCTGIHPAGGYIAWPKIKSSIRSDKNNNDENLNRRSRSGGFVSWPIFKE